MKTTKTLETYACNMLVYVTFRSTFATSRRNTCNIRLKLMKHLEHTLETYVHSQYNMCNISMYFCNINIQYLQHSSKTSQTIETYSYNMRFQLAAWMNGGSSTRSLMPWSERRYQWAGGCVAPSDHSRATSRCCSRRCSRCMRRGRLSRRRALPPCLCTELLEHKILEETIIIVLFLETDVATLGRERVPSRRDQRHRDQPAAGG